MYGLTNGEILVLSLMVGVGGISIGILILWLWAKYFPIHRKRENQRWLLQYLELLDINRNTKKRR